MIDSIQAQKLLPYGLYVCLVSPQNLISSKKPTILFTKGDFKQTQAEKTAIVNQEYHFCVVAKNIRIDQLKLFIRNMANAQIVYQKVGMFIQPVFVMRIK